MTKTRIRDLTIKGLVLAVAGVGLTLDAMAETINLLGYQVECSRDGWKTCRYDSWRVIAASTTQVYFVDTRKAKQKDVVWLLSMPMKGQDDFGKSSWVEAWQANCSTGEMRLKDATHFNQPWGKGDILGDANPSGKWLLVRPGSILEDMYNYACSKK